MKMTTEEPIVEQVCTQPMCACYQLVCIVCTQGYHRVIALKHLEAHP